MNKDFDGWNIHKKKKDSSVKRTTFKEKDIWWCNIGINIGDEENGKGTSFSRPVLVFKKFNQNIFLGIPLSTIIKEDKFYHKFHFKGIDQSLLLSQLKLLDAKRFDKKMGEISSNEFNTIKEKLRILVF